jgi:hypothetical protein
MDLVNDSPKSTGNAPPPLPPLVSHEEFARMSLKEKAEYLGKEAQARIARYAGRPELYLQENPHRDVVKRAQQAKSQAQK